MCFSAQAEEAFLAYRTKYDATIDMPAFLRLFEERSRGARLRVPKALEANFAAPTTQEELAVQAAIAVYRSGQSLRLEQELFAQSRRLATAQRKLQLRATKAASESARIAGDKIARAKIGLADLRRTALQPRDGRIFPGWFAPVMVWEHGRGVIRPMRYQCRLAGKPASYDRRFPGTYNARRDSLDGFWKPLFGQTHAVMVVDTFFENVTAADGRNQVLQFIPRDREPMLVACLWSRWEHDGEELLSFAAITDEPEPEVAAAGHDRTIINLRAEHVDAWLQPDRTTLEALQAIMDDKRHPYYEHRLAA